MTRGGVAVLVATVVCGLAAAPAVPSGAAEAAPALRPASAASVNRVSDTVLRHERFDYRRQNWRIRGAAGLPGWLKLQKGRLTGTAPRLGTWRIRLEERGIRQQGGERRRTVLVLRSVTRRAAPGTVLLSRGLGGRPANADSLDVTVSGDGSTVVFSSYATNLVRGTKGSVARLYVWDSASNRVSLLHPGRWAELKGVSHDGRRVLVWHSAGLFLLDRTDGSATQVARGAADAALTADGERVLYQDPATVPTSPTARLVEWTRATGATRTVVPDLQTRTFAGLSPNGRYALLANYDSSELLDTSTGTFRDLGPLGIEGGTATWVDVSDDARMVSVRGSGPAAGHGSGGNQVALVHDALLSTTRGPAIGNTGTAVTAGGSHYAVATAGRHLRVVEGATGTRTSPFAARPSGQELWASLSDDVSRVGYVSNGHDLLRGTRRGVANVYVWVHPR